MISIRINIFSRHNNLLNTKEKKLTHILDSIRGELDDHLDSINENTNETQSNYEFLCELDSKIDKINERLDELEMLFRGENPNGKEEPKFSITPLTKHEQEVFLVLYTAENSLLSYKDIAKRLALTETMARMYVTGIIAKGIPVIKHIEGSRVTLTLDSNFRALQAKKSIVEVSESVIQQVML